MQYTHDGDNAEEFQTREAAIADIQRWARCVFESPYNMGFDGPTEAQQSPLTLSWWESGPTGDRYRTETHTLQEWAGLAD